MKTLFLTLSFFAFSICASAQNVGIGNATPQVPLSFASTLGNKISLYGNNTTSIYGLGVQGGALQLFADNVNSDIVFGYGSSTIFNEKMRIKGSGNLGIGTPTPLAILHVSDPATEKLRLENTTGLNLGIRNELYFKTGTYFTGGIKTIGTAANAARLGFFTYAGTSSTALVERLTILDGGNVGIGKSDPTAKLEVNGTMKITDGTQGDKKVLTSDAAGNATWQNQAYGNTERFHFQRVRENGVETMTTKYNYGTAVLYPSGILYHRMRIIINTSGLYHFDLNCQVTTAAPVPFFASLVVEKNTFNYILSNLTPGYDNPSGYQVAFIDKSFDIYLLAGESIDFDLQGPENGYDNQRITALGHLISQ